MGGVIMERVYPSDFNMSENTSQESFVRVSEINDMIAYGVFKLDRNKLKEYTEYIKWYHWSTINRRKGGTV